MVSFFLPYLHHVYKCKLNENYNHYDTWNTKKNQKTKNKKLREHQAPQTYTHEIPNVTTTMKSTIAARRNTKHTMHQRITRTSHINKNS